MTKLTMRTLIVAAMLATPACTADVDTPAEPPSQPAAAAAAETAARPAPAPPDYASTLDIIEKVDRFYHNAWWKLLIAISGLILLVGGGIGVLVPWIAQNLQRKSFDAAKKELKDDIATVDAKFKALSAAQDKFSKSNEAAVAAIAKQLSASETALHRGVGAALAEVGMHSATMSTNVAGALRTMAYGLHESYLGNDRVQVLKTLAYITPVLSYGNNRECLKSPGVRKVLDTVLGEVQSMSQRGDDLSLAIATLRQVMIGRAGADDAADTES